MAKKNQMQIGGPSGGNETFDEEIYVANMNNGNTPKEVNVKRQQVEKKDSIKNKNKKKKDMDEEEEEQEEQRDEDQDESESDEESEESEEDSEDEEEVQKGDSMSRKKKLTEEWDERFLTFTFHGSFEDFSKDPQLTMKSLKEQGQKILGSNSQEAKDVNSPEDVQIKTGNNHMIHSISLVRVQNNFNDDIFIDLEGLDTKKPYFSAKNGEKSGLYMAHAKETNTNVNRVLVQGNEKLAKSTFLKKYPGFGVDNIRHGLIPVKAKNFLVPKKSPIIGVYKEYLQSNDQDFDLTLVNGHYSMNAKTVDEMEKVIKTNFNEKLKIRNLNDLKVKISRVNTDNKLNELEAWTDPKHGFENIDNQEIPKLLKQKSSLKMELKITYKNV